MHQVKLSLLTFTAMLVASLSTYATQSTAAEQSSTSTSIAQTTTSTDLLGAGATLINNWINPPTRSAEIAADAEIKKAKIAAEAEITKEKMRIEASKSEDKVTPLLSKWGVSRVSCAPGLVFVNGITTDTVCIQPSAAMTAGYYTYHNDKQQLVRNSTNNREINTNNTARNSNNGSGLNTSNTVHNTTNTSEINTNNRDGNSNLRSIRTVQSIKVSNQRQDF
jgi:hypothetical protein